jgi:hypothetical protein
VADEDGSDATMMPPVPLPRAKSRARRRAAAARIAGDAGHWQSDSDPPLWQRLPDAPSPASRSGAVGRSGPDSDSRQLE